MEEKLMYGGVTPVSIRIDTLLDNRDRLGDRFDQYVVANSRGIREELKENSPNGAIELQFILGTMFPSEFTDELDELYAKIYRLIISNVVSQPTDIVSLQLIVPSTDTQRVEDPNIQHASVRCGIYYYTRKGHEGQLAATVTMCPVIDNGTTCTFFGEIAYALDKMPADDDSDALKRGSLDLFSINASDWLVDKMRDLCFHQTASDWKEYIHEPKTEGETDVDLLAWFAEH